VLAGLVPIMSVLGALAILFTCTEWAWTHAGYVIIMLTPLQSLFNSRQIVSNVAAQPINNWPLSACWYLLFPLNRILPKYFPHLATGGLMVPEKHVALGVFVINLGWYCLFVVGTIGQICKVCDIWCLQLKPQKRQ
jgi:hypothetical protein